MKRRKRAAGSSALAFMDCICCGFGAVLLLFILTAKRQTIEITEESNAISETLASIQDELNKESIRLQTIQSKIDTLNPEAHEDFVTPLSELVALNDALEKQLQEAKAEHMRLLKVAQDPTQKKSAGLDRPTADARYLQGLNLEGPRVLILLTNSGSMLGEDAESALAVLRGETGTVADKWERAKAVVRSILAAIPKGTQVALFQMNELTAPIIGTTENPWWDPYDNPSLINALRALDALPAEGGHDLARAFNIVGSLSPAPSSMLLIVDGLPTAPATGSVLTEADRVELFRRALTQLPPIRTNAILLPFAGDPSAAGLYWRISARSRGTIIIPDPDWPPR
jgi:hypothetical protein